MPGGSRTWLRILGVSVAQHVVAVVLALVALGFSWQFLDSLDGPAFYAAFPAIVAAGWIGGLSPALLALAAYVVGAAYVLPPAGALTVASEAAVHRLEWFTVAGALVAALTGRLRTISRRERALREEAEREARARATAQRAAEVSRARAHAAGEALARQAARSEAARRRAEEAEEAARRTGHLQEQLLAVVGHDLRTPLSAIVMAAASLDQRGGLDERQARALERIRRSATRMGGLIRDLLDLARIRQGMGLAVQRAPTDAAEVCRQAVSELQHAHPDRTLHLRLAGELPVEGDGARLVQALANLLGNALQHGAADEPVEVEAGAVDGQVCIAVHNGGPPIPPDLQPVLFEPFQRGSTAGQGGLGLGLFIAREIARSHGGALGVRSTAESGTTFTLRLPALLVEAAAVEELTSSLRTHP